ncbi:AAA family ATPase [Chondrinema litorale]|uniref:AAA family ATPase n=1 Tax=Chondrinema litorale TaxID=2994555 RepID=UPI002542A792|nr:AAA family ATPase [Chondrinema litorale]UZR99987.1 AAA family ATPase [Chondrinema litorale]
MKDWGEVSEVYELINKDAFNRILENESEAQTRFDVIDRIVKDVLQWCYGQISVEKHTTGIRDGYIDYLLISGDTKIIIEAKKVGATFPSPTRRRKLKLTGTILGQGAINDALLQAEDYAKNIGAEIVVATNGNCWCFYPLNQNIPRDSIYATLLFPFERIEDAEELFNLFACHNVENDSLNLLDVSAPIVINKLHHILNDSDAKIGRNNIADHIMTAVDTAILSEALLENKEVLHKCYVSTENRTKYDNTLNMHLLSYKPDKIKPAQNIKKNKHKDEFSKHVEISKSGITPPVTLIIGSVGSGKSTYLKHFELIKGRKLLQNQKAHWIYIDLERLGKTGNPREFIYKSILDYLLEEHPNNPTDYKNVVEPAYEDDIRALARGPYGSLYTRNKDAFNDKVTEQISNDYKAVEPYVDKILKYLVKSHLCVIVIDNVDLYEDDELETTVFSEAISIAKKNRCNIFVSIRDTTYIKHRNDSIFNAYELKRFWIEPPSFREVLSKRLNYAQKVIEGESAVVNLYNGAHLKIDDLSVFFAIVQKSLLNEENGRFLEYLSDRNPRKGISYVQNFLSSAHIQADRAIKNYIEGDVNISFPFHEVFKGCMLSQWRYYKEQRSDALNIFDSQLSSQQLQLVRLYILQLMYYFSKTNNSAEVNSEDIIKVVSYFGISEDKILAILNLLLTHQMIVSNNNEVTSPIYSLTITGGYYLNDLCKRMVYIESILLDTNVFNSDLFKKLTSQTIAIDQEYGIVDRLYLRKERIETFMDYLIMVENTSINNVHIEHLKMIEEIKKAVLIECDNAINKAKRYY